jgi:hypothetical protein
MKNLILKVTESECLENPREWDNLGKMVFFHKRMNLGDDHEYYSDEYDNMQQLKNDILNYENVHTILPVYMYDHSGIVLSTAPFSCRFDSGQIGFIYATKESIDSMGCNTDKIETYLKNELEIYSKYLNNENYQYEIYEIKTCNLGCKHETLIDSCCGFFDYIEAEKEGKLQIENILYKEKQNSIPC